MGLSIIKHDKPAKFFGYFPDGASLPKIDIWHTESIIEKTILLSECLDPTSTFVAYKFSKYYNERSNLFSSMAMILNIEIMAHRLTPPLGRDGPIDGGQLVWRDDLQD